MSVQLGLNAGWFTANFLKLDASNDPITGDLLLKPTSDSTTVFQIQQADGTVFFNADSTNARVGIGTATPAQPLHVIGAGANLGGIRIDNTGSGAILVANRTDGRAVGLQSSGVGGSIAHETGGSFRIVTQDEENILDGGFVSQDSTTELFIAATTGLVGIGIGNVTPAARLHVKGTTDDQQLIVQAHSSQTANLVEIQDSSANVLSGVDERGILFSDGDTNASNVYIGTDAGNISASLAIQNVGIGERVMQSITTGDDNVGVGRRALQSVTDGNRNLAIGKASLSALEGGDNNTTFGQNSGQSLVSGTGNIFLGAFSGDKQTTLSNLLIIDNQTRTDIATELTNSILYGVMASTPASQTLKINATLKVSESLHMEAIETITGTSDTLDATNHVVLVDDDTAGSTVTITLPAVSGNTGLLYHIKKLGTTANVIVDANSSETIDGATTATLTTQYESIMIVAEAGGWHII